MSDSYISHASTEAGAPEIEIEITPAMIEAGAEVVSTYSPHNTTALEIAAETYAAMERIRLRQDCSRQAVFRTVRATRSSRLAS